ncbi:MAG: hypothetical protein K2N74_03015, partial [Clostridiales bacterium]|nr:hypothetical protein [Clostridiales bacterium]
MAKTEKEKTKKLRGGYSKRGLLWRLLGVLSLCAVLVTGVVFAIPNKDNHVDAFKATENAYNLVSPDDLYNGAGGLNSNVLNALSAGILGSGKTASDLITTATTAGTAGTSASKEITVKLGGLYWTPTYLSMSKGGKPILTLWLSGIDTTVYPTTYGQTVLNTHQNYSPFGTGLDLYNTAIDTPTNMYGACYMRAVTLNNGGIFISNETGTDANGFPFTNPSNVGKTVTVTAASIKTIDYTAGANADTANKFYRFTHGDLSNLIVTPADVAWQENQQNAVTQAGYSTGTTYGNINNEAWGSVGSITGASYEAKPLYSQWKDDKVWLPSFTELGNGNGTNGLWKTTTNQRKGPSGARAANAWIISSSTSNPCFVGYQAYTRTANNRLDDSSIKWMKAVMIEDNGSLSAPASSQYGTANITVVRPAIHLALGYAASDAEVVYNGSDWTTDSVLSAGVA